jgi:hypothetical protein
MVHDRAASPRARRRVVRMSAVDRLGVTRVFHFFERKDEPKAPRAKRESEVRSEQFHD